MFNTLKMTTENVRIRAELMARVADYIETEGITQTEAAKRFGTFQPRVNDVVKGRVDLCSIDRLVKMLASVGITLKIKTVRHCV